MATDADINAETKCKGEEPSPGPGHLSPWPSPLKGRGEVTFHVSVSILASFQLIPTYSSLFQRIFFRTVNPDPKIMNRHQSFSTPFLGVSVVQRWAQWRRKWFV